MVDNNLDIKIVLISDTLPDHLSKYSEHIILYKLDKSLNSSFAAQYIRLLYPALLNYENSILITDMDMLPLNSKYYINSIKNIDNDTFVYYRKNIIPRGNQYVMCYNLANNKTWSDIFKINSVSDIDKRLKDVYIQCNYANHEKNKGQGSKTGWETDQIDLYFYVNNWSQYPDKLYTLTDIECNYFRLDRGEFIDDDKVINDKVKQNCLDKRYSDFHAFRPNTEWREKVNEEIVQLSFNI